MKDDFTHNVTHELKTPIAISYAAIESIIHYNLLDNREKADKYLHLCHEELERLGGMVEQILSLSLETLSYTHLDVYKRQRVAFIDDALYYSDGVVARVENGKKIIRKGDFILRENDNLFVPCLLYTSRCV